jgi:hypothetical protein
MIRSTRLAVFWTWVAAEVFFAVAAKADDADSIFFHDDINKAIREAKLTKQPIFLEFRCAP